jgi:hypothetical protein
MQAPVAAGGAKLCLALLLLLLPVLLLFLHHL